jgi:hypothetical protein
VILEIAEQSEVLSVRGYDNAGRVRASFSHHAVQNVFLRIRLDIIYSSRGRDTERLRLGGNTVPARLPDGLMRADRTGEVPISTWDSTIIPGSFLIPNTPTDSTMGFYCTLW